MTPRKKALDNTDYDVVNDEPVNLDPPDPALARWLELADRDILIYHGGDAEKVIPFPRPAWADPGEDSISSTCYRSTPVDVATPTAGGEKFNNGVIRPAHFTVSTRIHGDGQILVSLRINRYVSGSDTKSGEAQWIDWSASMPPESALELADVLRAAVDLLGGAS